MLPSGLLAPGPSRALLAEEIEDNGLRRLARGTSHASQAEPRYHRHDRARCGGGAAKEQRMIRKLKTGQYRLYSRKLDPKTGKRRNLGTFTTRAAAEKHEREVQFFKRGGGPAAGSTSRRSRGRSARAHSAGGR
jgi:hypothetical protein